MRGVAAIVVMLAACGYRSPFTATGDGSIAGTDDATDGSSIDAPPSDSTFRRRIEIDPSLLAQPLDGFPILVTLGASCIDFAKVQSAGQDLRFVDSDLTTALPHEIEIWDEVTAPQVWVRVPQIAGADHIWMYYGDPDAADGQNVPAVWSSDFLAVWHLDEVDARDSTAAANHATASGGMNGTNRIPGQVGLAIGFDGGNDSLSAGDVAGVDGAATLTVTSWARTNQQATNRSIFRKADPGDAAIFQFRTGSTASALRATFVDQQPEVFTGSGLVTSNVWGHWGLVFDGTRDNANRVKLFFDGVGQATTTSGTLPATIPDSGTGPLRIGQHEFFDGAIDELRISRVVRSPDWIRTEHRSMTGALVTCGAEELVP